MTGLLPDGLLASPCVGICRIDPATGWCLGCARDLDELARWRDMPAPARAEVWADLPRRKSMLGLGFRLLPWSGPGLLDVLVERVTEGRHGCSIGVYGAVAEFGPRPGEAVAASRQGDALTLTVQGGALRLCPPAGARLFELVGTSGRLERLVVALHRTRIRDVPARGVTELGPDAAAIAPARRHHRLFDLGLTGSPIRFCVRTDDPKLVAALRNVDGQGALDPATGLVPQLLARAPDRVVLSPVGRIEVAGPILRADHAGPHTHLLPDLLAHRREMEPGFELPEGYVPCASLHPTNTDSAGP